MIKNDFIKRILEQVAIAMSEVLNLKRTKKHNDALVLLDETMQQLLGISSKTITSLPYEELAYLVKRGDSSDPDRLLVLSSLLKEKGDIYDELNDTSEFYNHYLKAFNLLIYTFNNYDDIDLKKYALSVEDFTDKLGHYVLPDETNINLFQYYKKAGQYSKCEDLIFSMIENNDDKDDLINMGIDFYEDLKLKSSDELEAGNLPIDEVEDGLQSLIKMKRD